MSDALHRLDGTLEAVWQRLARGVADRRAAARHPVLATVGRARGAEARVVVLRRADREAGVLDVHTDTASGKIAEIARDPMATLLVWDARAQLQIRLRVTVEVRQDLDAQAEWARVPDASRKNYGGTPPGTAIDAPEAAEDGAEAARFAVLSCRIDEIETLHLGRDRHYRAIFRRDAGFAGAWLAP